MDEGGNDIRPEFKEEAERLEREEAEAESKLAADLEDEERLADEYWRSRS